MRFWSKATVGVIFFSYLLSAQERVSFSEVEAQARALLLEGKFAAAMDKWAEAAERSSSMYEQDQAWVKFLSIASQTDAMPATLQALEARAQQQPADNKLFRRLSMLQLQLRNFEEAERIWERFLPPTSELAFHHDISLFKALKAPKLCFRVWQSYVNANPQVLNTLLYDYLGACRAAGTKEAMDAAIELCRSDPSRDIYRYTALVCEAAGARDKGIELLREGLSKRYSDDLHQELCWMLRKEKRLDEALAEAKKFYERCGDRFTYPLVLYRQLLKETGGLEAFDAEQLKKIEAMPDDLRTLKEYANKKSMEKDLRGAAELWRKIIERQPDFENYKQLLWSNEGKANQNERIRILEEMLVRFPENNWTRWVASDEYLRAGQREKAVEMIFEYERNERDVASLAQTMAFFLLRAGMPERSLDYFRKLDRDGSYISDKDWADIHAALNRDAEALPRLEKSMSNPDRLYSHRDTFSYIASIHKKLNTWDQCVVETERVAQEKPQDWQAQQRLALVREKQGRHLEAAELWLKVAAQVKFDVVLENAIEMFGKAGERQRLATVFERYLLLFPEERQRRLLEYADILLSLERTEQALTIVAEHYKLRANGKHKYKVAMDCGALCLKAGRLEPALEYYRTAEKDAGNNKEKYNALMSMAEVLKQKDRLPEALELAARIEREAEPNVLKQLRSRLQRLDPPAPKPPKAAKPLPPKQPAPEIAKPGEQPEATKPPARKPPVQTTDDEF